MKTVVNMTHEPIQVTLGGGRVLHLEPHGRGQVADSRVNSRSVRSLLEAGRIEPHRLNPLARVHGADVTYPGLI